jgi:hypothetical protein
MNIKTNNQPRRLFFACELSPSERTKLRDEFGWMTDEQFDSDCSFFKYRNQYYNLADFVRNDAADDSPLKGWHGVCSYSYFSGLLIKLCGNDVVVARFCS